MRNYRLRYAWGELLWALIMGSASYKAYHTDHFALAIAAAVVSVWSLAESMLAFENRTD